MTWVILGIVFFLTLDGHPFPVGFLIGTFLGWVFLWLIGRGKESLRYIEIQILVILLGYTLGRITRLLWLMLTSS